MGRPYLSCVRQIVLHGWASSTISKKRPGPTMTSCWERWSDLHIKTSMPSHNRSWMSISHTTEVLEICHEQVSAGHRRGCLEPSTEVQHAQ